ncbi:MAG: Hcp family type VI secretion system effector [Gaiellaceae bacterium]
MAFDAFLKIEGIEGESTDKTHPGEIEIQSFSWGVENTGSAGSGGGGGAGKATPQDFHFTSATSKASPNLMLACCTGRHFQKATLTCRKAGGGGQVEFVKIRLEDCLVSSYDIGGSADDGPPTDQFSLNFVKIDFAYTVAKTGEQVETAFDFRGLT